MDEYESLTVLKLDDLPLVFVNNECASKQFLTIDFSHHENTKLGSNIIIIMVSVFSICRNLKF